MQNIDKYRQKEIGQYISCLATVGEQVDICTDVAYRLTLWYSDQIQCLAEPSKFSCLKALACLSNFCYCAETIVLAIKIHAGKYIYT